MIAAAPLLPRRGVLTLLGTALVAAGAGAVWWRSATPAPSATASSVSDDICVVAPPAPYDPLSGLGLLDPRPIPADARCPVCGMYPARSPAWAAQLIFDNGDTQFFDSPVSLFLFTSNVQRFAPGRSIDQVARQYVTRVDGGTWLRAQDAFYVDGSSALGPMRAGNLPAFGSTTAAGRFADQRGGVVLTRAQIDQQVLDRLDTRGSHQHPERP